METYHMTQFRIKLLQATIFLSFIIANIHWQWGLKGIAAPLTAGLATWYIGGITVHLFDKLLGPAKDYAGLSRVSQDQQRLLLDHKAPLPVDRLSPKPRQH